MTPEAWRACTDPTPMLTFLGRHASRRKLRLFAVACCRRVERWLVDARSRRAVETAERLVDELATLEEYRAAEMASEDAVENLVRRSAFIEQDVQVAAAHTAHQTLHSIAVCAADYAAGQAASAAYHAATFAGRSAAPARAAEHAAQADLLRDVFQPFGAPCLPAAVLRWNAATVPRLAQSVYNERAFDRLPILADALEDAGCTDRAILAHLRGPGPHVRGCWVVDLILDKS